MNKKIVVIYHRADFDGIFCREIARKFLGDTAEYIGWDYGDAFVKMPEEGTVYILDLSPECLDASAIQGTYWNRIIWIDHHKSAIEKFSPEKYPIMAGYRIDGVAACRLAWQWFTEMRKRRDLGLEMPLKEEFTHRKVSEPLAVRLAGEYDIRDKRDPDAELFQHGLRSRELEDVTWKYLLSDDELDAHGCVSGLLAAGKYLAYAQTKQNESIITAYGFTMQFEGLTFLACNHARFNSHLFTAGIKPEHDALLGFNYDGSKHDWRFSLYGIPGKDIDLSLIAVKYGGGGHRGACGFRIDKIPFLESITREILTCVYCGMEYPEGTPPHGSQILTDHIKVCAKHPMQKIRKALCELVGCETVADLTAMSKVLEIMPESPERLAGSNAVKALLETA